MNPIKNVQIEDEAISIINFDAKARKCGGNELKRKCNCYGLTLKYMFAIKDLTYKDVGDIVGVTAQSINYLVNRASEESFTDIYMKHLCRKLSIDYQYFRDLSEQVRSIL